MNTPTNLFSVFLRTPLCAGALLLLAYVINARAAGSATWNLNPDSSVWYTSSNWTPATTPNTISDTATFGVSNLTTLSYAPGGLLSNLGAFAFIPGASAYTINFASNLYPAMIGAGVMNDSGVLQTFSVPPSGEFRDVNETNNMVSFINSATAGVLTQWTVNGSYTGAYRPGEVFFNDTATAATAILIIKPGGSDIGGEDGDGFGGILDFRDSSTADHATITVTGGAAGADYGSAPNAYFTDTATAADAVITMTGGTIPSGYGGILDFYSNSTASNATIVNQAGAVSGGQPGQTNFWDSATAGNATITANGGTDGAGGGLVLFYGSATGGTARVKLFGNGQLNINSHLAPGVTVGSVEGDGAVSLGANNLTIGSKSISTTFSGTITGDGSLTKIGSGKLTLTNANTYTGGTTVESGILLVNNKAGSGTGSGNVFVTGGTFGGAGTVAGRALVGTGSGSGAILAPGKSGVKPGTLTIQKRLILEADASYRVTFDSRTPSADKVISLGASVRNASILFSDLGASVIPIGTVFTLIDNTATTPITGAFTNLPDNSTITVGVNTFQANYEGGDGNDLTLTVVQ